MIAMARAANITYWDTRVVDYCHDIAVHQETRLCEPSLPAQQLAKVSIWKREIDTQQQHQLIELSTSAQHTGCREHACNRFGKIVAQSKKKNHLNEP